MPYIDERAWSQIIRGYTEEGYGYADYRKSEAHGFIERSYGVLLASPHVLVRDPEHMDGMRIFQYKERVWTDHQGMVVIGRLAFNELWPNM